MLVKEASRMMYQKRTSFCENVAALLGGKDGMEKAQKLEAIYEEGRFNSLSLYDLNLTYLTKSDKIKLAAALKIHQNLMTQSKSQIRLLKSSDAYHHFCPYLMNLDVEEVWVAVLNKSNRVLHTFQLGVGGVDSCIVCQKTLFRRVMGVPGAAGLLVAHNHPSGNCRPSTLDLSLTKKITINSKLLDLAFLDHLIIGHNGYYSCADENNMS